MACMECLDCGKWCNSTRCQECGSNRMVWDEEHLYYDDYTEGNNDDE